MRNPLLALITIASTGLIGCTEQLEPNRSTGRPDVATTTGTLGVNVLLKAAPTSAILADLNTIGTVLDVLPQVNGLTMRASVGDLAAIRAKPYVASAARDPEVAAPPEPPMAVVSDFVGGQSMWNLDAINVTVAPGFTGRNPDLKGLTGTGVYVGVLDSGLIPEWGSIFPAERIDVGHARAFGGGGGERGTVSSQPNKWEDDVYGHGTAVASVVIGFLFAGVSYASGPVNGTAPGVTIIPVKVLNQNGGGWASVLTRGILYVAELKAGALAEHPVIINMSLVFPPDPLMKAAIDYAISKGVLIVAAAGNNGAAGMLYPGAYPPVISAAATGWVHQWEACGGPPVNATWFIDCDVAEPTSSGDFYLADWSSRQLTGQQLDLAAPGALVVVPVPYRGGVNYRYAVGTSYAAPQVAGVVALMAEKVPSLRQAEAEAILKSTAIALPPGSRRFFELFDFHGDVVNSDITVSWGADATGAGLLDAVGAVKATH